MFHNLDGASTISKINCFLEEPEQFQIEADNLIDFFTEIPTIEECIQLCNDESTCTALTLQNSVKLRDNFSSGPT